MRYIEAPDLLTEVKRILADNPQAGRYTVARALNVSEKRARKLLQQARGHQPEQMVRLEVERLKAQREKQELARTKKVLAVAEIIAEKFAMAVAALPPITPPKAQPVVHTGEAEDIVCLISDMQGGELIDAEEMGGLNEYTFAKLERETWTYLEKLRRIIAERRGAGKQVRRLHVWLLGDIVDGETIYDGQQWHIEQNVFDQSVTLYEMLAQWIVALLELGVEVVIETIPGNHGRVGKKGQTAHRVNFDNFLYQYLSIRFRGIRGITFNGPHKSWYKVVDILGWKFHLSHGDDVKGWGGIPFYGFARAYTNDFMLQALIKESFQYWVCGDKHVQFSIDMGPGEIIVNGNWVGTSYFSAKALHKGGRPSQTVFGVTEREGVTWRQPIYLDIPA